MTQMDAGFRVGIVDQTRERRLAIMGSSSPAVVNRILGRPPGYIPPPPKPAAQEQEPPPAPAPVGGLTRERIVREVSVAFDVSLGEILSPWRPKRITRARICIYALMRELFPRMSLPAIGRYVRRDHSTVKSGLDRAKFYEKTDPDWLLRATKARVECLKYRGLGE